MAQPAPGWFPDPFDPAQQRWWDGRRWTTDLRPAVREPVFAASSGGHPTVDAGAPDAGAVEVAAADVAAPHHRRRVAAVALATAGALLLGGAVATAGGVLALVPDEPGTSSRAVSAPLSSSRASTSPSSAGDAASPSPPRTAVPVPTPRRVASPGTPVTPAPRPVGKATGLVPVVSVTDGDTIRVRLGGVTERVRVIGVDTPELRTHECYAQQAASEMQRLVQGREVRLVRDPSQADRDRYGRLLRHVALPDGRQVAQVLIAGGFGEEYTYDRAYAGQRAYRDAERSARAARRGIWSSGCKAPDKVTASGSCLIKGNIAGDGARIYHLPGQRYYEVTKISLAKGERWFCTQEQARDAGWRPSRL